MMKFASYNWFKVVPEYDRETRERIESLVLIKPINVKVVVRTTNEIEEGFKGIFPKTNGFTLNKEITKGDVIEGEGVKYRVIHADPIPRLTSLYLELM